MISNAKSMLPNMPDEVFDGFLKPLIIDHFGWPFTSVNDLSNETEWFRILHPFSLKSFSNLQWQKIYFVFNQGILHPVSRGDINLIIMNNILDMFPSPEHSESSRDTLTRNKAFIKSTGQLPSPPVTAITPNGVKIFDGNHRVAALFDLGLNNKIPVDTWHGT